MDATSIFFNIVISAFGFAYFSYGRKAPDLSALVCGVILMIYPYFITGLAPLLIIGAVLAAIPFIINRYF